MAYYGGGFGGGMNMNALMQQARKMQEQMQKAEFSYNDFLRMQKQMKMFGSMDQLLGMIPGLNIKKEDREMISHKGEEEFKKIADLCFPHITKTPEDYYKMYPARNLPEGTEVTRFAPSPTGYMHIGGVYQALINSFIAHKTPEGIFYLRNEDTDSKREVKGAANIFVPALDGFGVAPDEGVVSETEEKGA